jgi:hypothetical protein
MRIIEIGAIVGGLLGIMIALVVYYRKTDRENG